MSTSVSNPTPGTVAFNPALSTADPTSGASALADLASAINANAATAAAALQPPYVQRPDLICAGAGTEASPWTTADGTAGLTASVAALSTRGGLIDLLPGRFDYTTSSAVVIGATRGVTVRGRDAGFPNDYNGEVEGTNGTKVRLGSVGIVAYANPRSGGITFEAIYFVGTSGMVPGANEANTGIAINSVDTARVIRCRFGNLGHGVKATGSVDSMVVEDPIIIHCGVGVEADSVGGTSYYARVNGGCIADNDQAAFISGTIGGGIRGCLIVRVCRAGGYVSSLYGSAANCAVLCAGAEQKVEGNDITYSGTTLNGGTLAGVDGVLLAPGGDRSTVIGNVIANSSGYGVHVKANGCVISGNTFNANVSGDVLIDSSATGTTVVQPGAAITDNGVRSIVNGVGTNAGDPATTGQWHGVTPPNGTVIVDATGGVAYLYHSALTGGRKQV